MWKLNSKERKQINKQITNLPIYHESIPLTTLDEILNSHGLLLLQEDQTQWSGFLCGDSAHTTFEIGVLATEHEVNGLASFEPVVNCVLVLTWHKMSSGRYEIVSYMS